MFPAKEAPASSHMLVSRAERGLQATIWSSGRTSKHFWCKKGLFSSSPCETVFPAKEAPASSHMLVSRAERGLQATIWSSIPSVLEAGRTPKHLCKKGLFFFKFLRNSMFPAKVSLQETCCFARRLNKQAFLHYLDALLLFLKESPEDLAQPVRQAYDYWSFLQ